MIYMYMICDVYIYYICISDIYVIHFVHKINVISQSRNNAIVL